MSFKSIALLEVAENPFGRVLQWIIENIFILTVYFEKSANGENLEWDMHQKADVSSCLIVEPQNYCGWKEPLEII